MKPLKIKKLDARGIELGSACKAEVLTYNKFR